MRRADVPTTTALLTVASDACTAAAACLAAWWLRFHSGHFTAAPLPPVAPYQASGLLWVLLTLAALQAQGAYRVRVPLGLRRELGLVTRAVVGVEALLFALSFFLRRELEYSRIVALLLPACGTVLMLGGRALLRDTWGRIVEQRQLGLQTLLLGEPEAELAQQLLGEPGAGRRLLGWVSLAASPATGGSLQAREGRASNAPSPGERPSSLRCLGRLDELPQLLAELEVDELLVVSSRLPWATLEQAQLACEQQLVSLRVVCDLFGGHPTRLQLEQIQRIALLGKGEPALQRPLARALKRCLDIVGSLVGLLLGAPVMLAASWLVRRESPGPALYAQERCGLDGKVFWLYKLRTMAPDAEHVSGPTMATADDPRATPTGAWLRRTHLDELPQLYNVLRGDMSLVGPRPERPFFVERFRREIPRYMERHGFKPGMTGWAQIHGLRGPTCFVQRVERDLEYTERWSLWLDLRIVAATLLPWLRPAAARPAQAGPAGASPAAPVPETSQPTSTDAAAQPLTAPLPAPLLALQEDPTPDVPRTKPSTLSAPPTQLAPTLALPTETQPAARPQASGPTPLSYDSQWPHRGSRQVLRDLLERRALIGLLVRRDLMLRYRGSLLGVAWNLLNPTLTVAVIWLVFSHVLRQAATQVPFVLYLLTGVVVSTFVTTSVQVIGSSLQSSVHLLKKIYLPAEVLAFSTALSLFVSIVLLLLPPLLVLQVLLGVGLPWTVLLAPLPLLLMLGACLGLGLWVAAAAVQFADVLDVVRVLLQLTSYLTPTFYSLSILPAGVRLVVQLNPITHYLELFRALCFGSGLGDPISWGVAVLSASLLLSWGSRAYVRAAQLAVAR